MKGVEGFSGVNYIQQQASIKCFFFFSFMYEEYQKNNHTSSEIFFSILKKKSLVQYHVILEDFSVLQEFSLCKAVSGLKKKKNVWG